MSISSPVSNIHCIPSLKLFWTDVRDGPEKPGWNPAFTEVERNIIIANYGGSQGFDNDDGSSWYDIHHNVIYGEGLKQDCKLFDRALLVNLRLVYDRLRAAAEPKRAKRLVGVVARGRTIDKKRSLGVSSKRILAAKGRGSERLKKAAM